MKFDRASLEMALKVEGHTNIDFWTNLFLIAGIPDGYYTSEGFIDVMGDFIRAVNLLAKKYKKAPKDAFFMIINKKENTFFKPPEECAVLLSKPRVNYIIKYYQQKEINAMLEIL